MAFFIRCSTTPIGLREFHRTKTTMRANFFLLFLLTAALASAAQFKFGNQTFTVPDGFTVDRVAGPPLVNRPIEASFDEQGRLYVTDSSGSNARVPEQIKNPTHRIVRLEDTNGDGQFNKSVVFADKMIGRAPGSASAVFARTATMSSPASGHDELDTAQAAMPNRKQQRAATRCMAESFKRQLRRSQRISACMEPQNPDRLLQSTVHRSSSASHGG